MIAFVERFVHENETESVADDESICRGLEIKGSVEDDSALACKDFGGIRSSRPIALVRPADSEDVSRILKAAARSSSLTVAARGNGHSINGQAMAHGGLVLNMRAMEELHNNGSSSMVRVLSVRNVVTGSAPGFFYVDVGGGALWSEVLERCVSGYGLAPRSWTDYLDLTVGGTLSNAGISGQSFRYGPQTSNVSELEVVTGKGDTVVCSHTHNSDLFFAVLGGLGQFGVITRARILLQPAPHMVRWIRLVYSEFNEFAEDAEYLVTRPEGDLFDYVEGFAFANSDDPVNGYPSVPLDHTQTFDRNQVPGNAGPILYCLEVALHYSGSDHPTTTNEAVEKKLGRLRFCKHLLFHVDVSYMKFLSRVKQAEESARINGIWDASHPWLNMLICGRDIAEFDRTVFKRILKHGVGGPMLVYPMLRSKWDDRTSVVLPEGEIFYLVALLRFNLPYPQGPPVEELVSQNREIIQICINNNIDFKLYLPHYNSQQEWKQHFGHKWPRFVEHKVSFDPMAILAPGHGIFSRNSQS